MTGFRKRLSLLMVTALVISSIGLGFGQMKATAYADALGTGIFKVEIVVAANDCANSTRGTQSSFRLQFLDAADGVVSATPDNAIIGTGSPNPLESLTTTTYTWNGSGGGNVAVTVPSLAAMAVNKTITQVQLVNTAFEDDWAFSSIKVFYSPDNGTNYELLADNTWTGSTAGAAVTWSVGTYFTSAVLKTLSFDANGGSGGSTYDAIAGQTVTAPTAGIKEGYTFTGWTPSVPATMPAANATYVAQWTIKSYEVYFDCNGGTCGGDGYHTLLYGETLIPPVCTRTGYTFTGWSPEVPATVPADNVTYVAQWSINTYTAYFDCNGGTCGGNGLHEIQYGAMVTPPTCTRIGYTFAGWSPAIPSTMPAANVTYVAQWVINQYTVSFDSAGGSAVADITQNYGTEIIAPAAPLKAGYTFAGWQPVLPEAMPAENVECVAQWTLNSYSITFDANGGAGGDGRTVNYGELPVAPVVTRTNYRFAGWSPELAAAVQNTVYTAQWIMLGDLSASNTISSLDALMVLQYVAGLTTLNDLQLLHADVDMNGVVNNIDALKILQFASEIIIVFT